MGNSLSFLGFLRALQSLIHSFRALQVRKRSSDNSFICLFLRLIAPSDRSVGFTPGCTRDKQRSIVREALKQHVSVTDRCGDRGARTLIKSLEPCSAHRRASWGALGCLPHRLRNVPEMFHALRRHPPVFADFLRAKWLRVLATTERTQVNQRIRHQLHPIVSLLNTFKAEQQPLELVLPGKGPLDPQA